MLKEFSSRWWVLLLRGICAIAAGIIAIMIPGIALASLVLLFALFAIADGVASIIISPDGTFTLNYTPEPIQLGIIETNLNGLDASDQDKKINIRQWPVKGMYQPDAIAGRIRFLLPPTRLMRANTTNSGKTCGSTATK